MSRSLAGWLAHIEQQHPSAIDLGLERVATVWRRMNCGISAPVFTVGGTNGKGSTCAMLDCILRSAGYRTGRYSSPHLLHYNERVMVDGMALPDHALVAGFEAVDAGRGEVSLTYFEYGTLAALWLFARERLDALVLEVGLGGRLDAVNIIDADCAILSSIGIDHVGFLGATREAIGAEKAGIFRPGRPAVVADPDPPQSVREAADRAGARLLLIGRDFDFAADAQQWQYRGLDGRRVVLAHPALRGRTQLRNASAAIAALQALEARLPVAMKDIRQGLAHVFVPGRFQTLPGRPQVILDVAHNPDAARVLADNLAAGGYAPDTIAVIGMLGDKDVEGVVRALAERVTRWHVAALGGARGGSGRELLQAVKALAGAPAFLHASPAEAFDAARRSAGENDKIVVCGSFLTVAEVMAVLEGENRRPAHG